MCPLCTIVILTKFRKKEPASFFGSMRFSSVRAANWESINDVTAFSISFFGMSDSFAKSSIDFLPSISCLKTATTVGSVKIAARLTISASGALERKSSRSFHQNACVSLTGSGTISPYIAPRDLPFLTMGELA